MQNFVIIKILAVAAAAKQQGSEPRSGFSFYNARRINTALIVSFKTFSQETLISPAALETASMN